MVLVIAHEPTLRANDSTVHHQTVPDGDRADASKDVIKTNFSFPKIIGQSTPIHDVCRLIGLVAQTDATVLVQGESGTGKELVAQAIHFHSRRNKISACSLKNRLEHAERQIILETLRVTNGVKNQAAQLLGIDRRNFGYFLHKHGIH